jgi:hypothetical protein
MSFEEFCSRLIGLVFVASIAGFVIFAARGGDLSAKQAFLYGLCAVIGVWFAITVLGSLKRWLLD